MKRLLNIFFVLAITQFAYAQTDIPNLEWKQNGDLQFGAFGGLTESSIQEEDFTISGESYLLGIQLDYFFGKNWSVKTRLNYENRDYGFNLKSDFLTVPVLANWHFGKNRRWNLHFGVAYTTHLGDDIKLDGFASDVGIGLIIPINKMKFFIELDGMHNFDTKPYGGESKLFVNRSSLNIGILF